MQLLSNRVHKVLVGGSDVHDKWSNFYASFCSRHVSKVVFQRFLALDTSIGDLANFIAIKLFPLLIIKSFEKVENVYRVDKIDEGIAHVAPVFEINREIEEVVLIPGLSVNGLQ